MCIAVDVVQLFQVPGFAISTVRKLLITWKFMLMEQRRFANCYRVAITTERKRAGRIGVKYQHTLCFWCLDPQVAFAYLGATCHSVILASGEALPLTLPLEYR